MLKIATKIVLAFAICATLVLITAAPAQAQDAQQRAYDAGYQNGVNDHNQNKALNLKTDNWHGENLSIYERGYQDGYNKRSYGRDEAQQRAYQAGYQNGVNDRSRNKPLNLSTDNWHGQNLDIYQHGYKDGYQGGGQDRHDDHY